MKRRLTFHCELWMKCRSTVLICCTEPMTKGAELVLSLLISPSLKYLPYASTLRAGWDYVRLSPRFLGWRCLDERSKVSCPKEYSRISWNRECTRRDRKSVV